VSTVEGGTVVGKRVEGCAGPAASPTVGFIVGVLPELAVAQPPIDTGFAIEFAAGNITSTTSRCSWTTRRPWRRALVVDARLGAETPTCD
jgi:hypothetical protein